MKAYDLMTRDVLIVSPDTTVAAVAHLLHEHRIGGVRSSMGGAGWWAW